MCSVALNREGEKMAEKPTILVADDEPEALSLLKDALEAEGYCVKTALDGNEALEKCRSVGCDVLIADLKMPGMDGLKLSKKMKRLNPRAEVILITAYSSLESAIRAMRNGIFDYIPKPVDIPDLLKSVRGALKKQRLSTRRAQLIRELSSVNRELEEHRRLAEQKSIQYQKLYQEIVSNIPSSILLIDRDFKVVSANRNFLEKSGTQESSVLGRSIDAVFPSALLNTTRLLQKIEETFETGEPIKGGELTYTPPGLPTRVYFYRLTPIKGGGGSVDMVMLLMDDITERIHLSEKIRQTQHHLASVVESASDIVISMDAEGRILTWNSSAKRVSGFNAEEVIGKHLVTFCIDEERGEMRSMLARLAKGGESIQNVEINLMTKLGKPVLISWSCSPMRDDTGRIVGIVGVGRDLSERRLLEAQLIQSAKMVSLGVMAGGIAHEIRNPLAICSSAAQLLVDSPNDGNLQKKCAMKIYSNIRRASHVIENLLKFARPSGDDFSPVDLNETLEETLSLVEHQMTLQQITLHREFVRTLPMVTGNKNLLQQVFLNITLNAFNAMPEGGELTISTGTNSEGQVEIRFADTGCGISRENLDKIFDPFFTTMPVGKGTGLGLSVSYGIIQQHGGSIEVESELGVGTTFTVKLPVKSRG